MTDLFIFHQKDSEAECKTKLWKKVEKNRIDFEKTTQGGNQTQVIMKLSENSTWLNSGASKYLMGPLLTRANYYINIPMVSS